ncbi:hypothetical protein BT96DRAFT_946049 [Gymnopus androsaceus JB14]|uniref:Uncharacterized protein n=1 Tax=Gymnopus androsaceus JB14 TaxID=1447944 RepID=A0A6A4H018_9AGAR|nr:hypothetical protein BT96DRAFT_946049 [Gymnopus androsaceus JB14]
MNGSPLLPLLLMDLQLLQSSSATFFPDEGNVSEAKTAVFKSEFEHADEPGCQEFRQELGLRPPERFIFPNITAITRFSMAYVLETNDIMVPQNINRTAIAVIQGLDVGYFESWTLTSEYVHVTGTVYSFHSTFREAQICYI